jgi:hypothetical protein
MYLTLARVPIERPHHADARHHGGSILFGDQDQAPIWRAPTSLASGAGYQVTRSSSVKLIVVPLLRSISDLTRAFPGRKGC